MSLNIDQKETESPCDDKVDNRLLEILQELIIIPSSSGCERKLATYLIEKFHSDKRWVVKKNEKDPKWNVYIFPRNVHKNLRLGLLNAHLDTFPKNGCGQDELKGKEIFEKVPQNDSSCCINKKFPDIFYGFDDKIGVAIILYLMQYTDLKFYAILSTEEEKTYDEELQIKYAKSKRNGGGGIESALIHCPEFFTNASWAITLDRANKTNIITEYGGESLCSPDFHLKLKEISQDVGFPMKTVKGQMGDAYNIRVHTRLNVVNLSVGFYSEHDIQKEKLNISYAVGSLKVVEECLKSEEFSTLAKSG